MITALVIGLVPLLALPVLRRAEVNLHREARSVPATPARRAEVDET
jgi:hypothetical protein